MAIAWWRRDHVCVDATRLQLGGISSRRLILVPEEQDERQLEGRPRIRRYRLGILSDHAASAPTARRERVRERSTLHAQSA
jgi:hypothetical protein